MFPFTVYTRYITGRIITVREFKIGEIGEKNRFANDFGNSFLIIIVLKVEDFYEKII